MNSDANQDSALKFLRQQRRLVEAQVSKLQDILSHLKGLEDFYANGHKQTSLAIESLSQGTDEYKNLGLGEAIIKIHDDRPDKYWTPPEVAEELLRGGFESTAINFKGSVAATMMRLASQGQDKLQRTKRAGGGSKYKSVIKVKK